MIIALIPYDRSSLETSMNEFESKEDLMKELTDTLSALQTSVKSSERFDNTTAGEQVN